MANDTADGMKAGTNSARRDSARYDAGLSASENKRIQAAGATGIVTSYDRLGGSGAVELRRGNRLDVYGGFGHEIWIPNDPFDLSPSDEAAADKLTGALVLPSTVKPWVSPVSWCRRA